MTRPEMSGKIGPQPGSVWRVTRMSRGKPVRLGDVEQDRGVRRRASAACSDAGELALLVVRSLSHRDALSAPEVLAGRQSHRVRRRGRAQLGVRGLGAVRRVALDWSGKHRAAGSEQFELLRGQNRRRRRGCAMRARGGEPLTDRESDAAQAAVEERLLQPRAFPQLNRPLRPAKDRRDDRALGLQPSAASTACGLLERARLPGASISRRASRRPLPHMP